MSSSPLHSILAKVLYFTHLGFPEIRGIAFLTYLLGAQVVWCRYNLTRFHVLDIFSSAFSSVGLSMSSSDPTFFGLQESDGLQVLLVKKKKLARFQSKMSSIWMILTTIWWKPFTLCPSESPKNDPVSLIWLIFSCPDRTEKEILFDMKVLSKLNRKEMTGKIQGNESNCSQPASMKQHQYNLQDIIS